MCSAENYDGSAADSSSGRRRRCDPRHCRGSIEGGGFEFTSAKTGEEAVTLLKGRLVAYCALVTDINLLGSLTGWEVARAARETDPNLPVVYISGAAAHDWPAQGVPNSIILQKPFALAQLTTAVSQLLNERSVADLGKA